MSTQSCATCSEEYIEETERALAVRKKEYCDVIRLGRTEKLAIAEHVHNTLHEIDWESLRIIDRASWKRERRMSLRGVTHSKEEAINEQRHGN